MNTEEECRHPKPLSDPVPRRREEAQAVVTTVILAALGGEYVSVLEPKDKDSLREGREKEKEEGKEGERRKERGRLTIISKGLLQLTIMATAKKTAPT